MKRVYIFLISFFVSALSFGQVQFLERFAIEAKFEEDNFMTMYTSTGFLCFRTIPEKLFSIKNKLQLFKGDFELNTSPIQEIILRDGYQLLGFDIEQGFFYALLQKGQFSDNRYIIEINLANEDYHEVNITNVLDMELDEFLVLNRKAIFMGTTDLRPVVQIFDIESSNVFTVQDLYSNKTKILQIQKDPEFGIIDLLISKRDPFKIKQVSVLTLDDSGNKIREVVIDKLENPAMEIVEGILTPAQNFQQHLIGPFGQRRRESFHGIYLTNINEFGENITQFYTLEDFPNFYNYLNDKAKEKKLRQLEREIGRGKIPSIKSVLSTREVIEQGNTFLVYHDIFSASHPRYLQRDGVYANNLYRRDPFYFQNMMYNNPAMGYRGYPRYYSMIQNGEFNYTSAHFLLLNATGEIIWENALSLNEMILSDPGKFGEVSFDGDKLHFMYLDGTEMMMSYIRNGEVIFENEPFEIELINEKERIRDTQEDGLKLSWWFSNYYLLSGKQRIRFQNETGKEEIREEFFLTKIKVDGDQFVPEEEN